MNAVFYSLAFAESQIAPVQLLHSVRSLRHFDRHTPVFAFLFGMIPAGFAEALRGLNVTVRDMGSYRDYIATRQPERADLIALDPKIHRWLVLAEPELKACTRLLYIDSDTYFFGPVARLFDRYLGVDMVSREEPCCRRSPLGYDPAYVDEEAIAALQEKLGAFPVRPFNTGVCLMSRAMADAALAASPLYFDYLFRFLSWFKLNPHPSDSPANSSTRALYDDRFQPMVGRALPYPSVNRWIIDQVALWLALGQFDTLRYADFQVQDVKQAEEFQQITSAENAPLLCHYFGSNTEMFFGHLQRVCEPVKDGAARVASR